VEVKAEEVRVGVGEEGEGGFGLQQRRSKVNEGSDENQKEYSKVPDSPAQQHYTSRPRTSQLSRLRDPPSLPPSSSLSTWPERDEHRRRRRGRWEGKEEEKRRDWE